MRRKAPSAVDRIQRVSRLREAIQRRQNDGAVQRRVLRGSLSARQRRAVGHRQELRLARRRTGCCGAVDDGCWKLVLRYGRGEEICV